MFFHQGEGIGKHLPRWFINQPWNLQPIFSTAGKTSKKIHINIIHCRKINSFKDFKIYYKYSMPEIYKKIIVSTINNSVKIFKGLILDGQEEDNIDFKAKVDIEIPDSERIN